MFELTLGITAASYYAYFKTYRTKQANQHVRTSKLNKLALEFALLVLVTAAFYYIVGHESALAFVIPAMSVATVYAVAVSTEDKSAKQRS